MNNYFLQYENYIRELFSIIYIVFITFDVKPPCTHNIIVNKNVNLKIVNFIES